jgi:Cupin-like domain
VLYLDRSSVPDNQILKHFSGAQRPVVIRGYLGGTALAGITFDDIAARAGHMTLDPAWKPSLVYQTCDSGGAADGPMLLSDYLEKAVLGSQVRQDLYVRFRNLRVPLDLRNALGLIRPGFLRPHEVHLPCIWMGGSGSCSNLHTDPQDNFVLSVVGLRRFWLHAPSELAAIQAESIMGTAFLRSPFDPRRADHPARFVVLDLMPGDLLMLPLGWPHFVECITPSFSYNYWLDPRETPFFERKTQDDLR